MTTIDSLFQNCMTAMFQSAANEVNRKIDPKSNSVRKNGQFKCIYFDNACFVELMSEVESYLKTNTNKNFYGLHFLDVGCGAGQKVWLANQLGLYASGLDYYQEFVDKARELIKIYDPNRYENTPQKIVEEMQNRIFQADATTFEGYDKFDIIYFYRPIADREGQKKLEKQVAKFAKKGTIVLPVFDPEFFGGMNKDTTELEKLGWKSVEVNNHTRRFWVKTK